MDRGTDVAREAASIVLLDDDFSSIVAAIRLGRRIFDNIKKAIAFILAVLPIVGLSMIPVFVPGWPLLLFPVHIAFIELIIDPSCSLIFEAEEAEDDVMRRRPRRPDERLFAWSTIGVALAQGLSVLAACIVVFVLARRDQSPDAARSLTFATLVVAFLAVILVNRSWARSAFSMFQTRNAALQGPARPHDDGHHAARGWPSSAARAALPRRPTPPTDASSPSHSVAPAPSMSPRDNT